jgi:branched-chain amino acid transport system substrate-binding protein
VAGDPVVVQFANLGATSSTLPAAQGAKAAVAWVNANGGIGGRPLKLVTCATDTSAEQGKACVDRAVAEKPTAVLAVQPGGVADNLAALTAAGIPYVGQTCNTNATASGQFASFCFGSDFVGLYTSAAGYLKGLGTVKKVALPYPGVPAASTGVKAYGVPTFTRAGIAPTEVPIPDGTTDLAAVVTPMYAANPDAVVGLLNGPACLATMKARGTRTSPLVLPALCSDPELLADAGTAAVGSLFVRQTLTVDPADPDVKAYTKAMQRWAPRTDRADVYAQAGFAAVANLTTVQRTITGAAVDAAGTLAALRAAKAVHLFLGGGTTATCDGTAYPGLKALCSVQAHVVAYDGKGRFTDKGPF